MIALKAAFLSASHTARSLTSALTDFMQALL
jgi:hypothetical protein